MNKIRILIVDDEKLLLESLELILSMNESFAITGLAHDGKEALDILEKEQVDIALVDLNMEGMSGQELILKVKATYPKMKILVLTTFYDEENIVKAVMHGADGYLLKDAGTKVIVQGIFNVMNGQSMLDSKVMTALANIMSKCSNENTGKEKYHNIDLLKNLTEREIEICQLLSDGYTNSQIAEFLYISEGTVKNYISTIYDKTEIKDRTMLALKLAKIFS
ncbi:MULTISPECIES: response regulator [Clostridium]|uniref:Stage 0 sporulation protein A homolog n=2 Tax=Clostridium TaxID=1485 RepID=A0A9Q5CPY5_CLOBE|nr:response regulator transcription factor [Clostridium beijerinckii]AQS06579.1 transcriptional regulatory protein DegU [Clostridium beijerinckii]MBA2887151.1 DNA-binding NarL/FixJ family response regulator [Clostridium beijerinckii]MBA2902042.1 DNA-binding NarL/FixJ family response regulator [Clostridium beijerinckii]MBA2911865.1 DNA-binding NarL/FixJ family response regulator [Clostridium beijerinckii]MBA9013799.1 DNA-binding NarL/FixJ family response regulator [Clostridium beijerinckii]